MRTEILEILDGWATTRGQELPQYVPYINGKPAYFGGTKSYKSEGLAIARLVRACKWMKGKLSDKVKVKEEILRMIKDGIIEIKRVV